MISSVSSSHGLCHFCLCTAVTRSPENRGFIRSLILRLVSCSVALGLMCPLCTLDLGTRSLHQPCRIRLPLPAKWFSGVLDFPNPLFYTNKTNKDIGHSPLCSCGLLAPVYRRGPFPPIPCARSVLGFRFVQAKSTVAFVESSSQCGLALGMLVESGEGGAGCLNSSGCSMSNWKYRIRVVPSTGLCWQP
ncbi:uncharacterized protein [Physcomitrium patens]|uniref:uncharacterized protein n=1 Tax=Physcomitrium patens TaxID=3218 RepID=UPI003CCD0C5A